MEEHSQNDRQVGVGWFVPEPDEDASTIHRPRVEGWVMVQRADRRIKVLRVQVVRFWGNERAEVLYPSNHWPRYIDGFGYPGIHPLSEAEALAWLREHKLPLPAKEGDAAPQTIPEGD